MKMLLATSDQIAPVLLRLTLGGVMFPHGAQKALGLFGGDGVSATIAGFDKMGVSSVLTMLVIAAEFLGSIGLILGFLTRVAALGIGAVMVGAIQMVHWQHGFFMDWRGTHQVEGFEYHILAIGIAAALLITGGGRWSIDRAVSH